MKHILKNLNIGGLLALVAGMVLMVSWKAVESNKAVSQWYRINITDLSQPNNPANQEIDGLYPGGAPGSDCPFDEGYMCALPIDLKEYTGTISTVEHAQQLANDGEIELGQPVFRNQP